MDAPRIRLACRHQPTAKSRRDLRDVHPTGRESDDQKHYHHDEKRDDEASASWRTRRPMAYHDSRFALFAVEPVHSIPALLRARLTAKKSFVRNADVDRSNYYGRQGIWSGGQGSDLRPFGPKPNALPPELPPDAFLFGLQSWRPLPVARTCRLSSMTIRATQNTLREFFSKGSDGRADMYHFAYVVSLRSSDVVKFENYRVALTAVDT